MMMGIVHRLYSVWKWFGLFLSGIKKASYQKNEAVKKVVGKWNYDQILEVRSQSTTT